MSQQLARVPEETFVTKNADGSVDAVVDEPTRILDSRGMKVFTIIDHSGEAHEVGLELRETKVVIFGKPEAGTGVMQSAPLAALDLPLKVLIWDDAGQTKVTYTAQMD